MAEVPQIEIKSFLINRTTEKCTYRVKAVIEKNDFVPTGVAFSDQDVSGVRIAVDVPELVDHVGVHLRKKVFNKSSLKI